jgi:tRNA dimethylallyltransferase
MEETKRAQHAASKTASSPIIVIVGQTASGKSGLAMDIAVQFNGEIICADSRTIYKGMDIGTAKPSESDRRAIPHHGLDLIEPTEYFSAAAFQAYTRKKVADIQSRGRLPIIVGGTGLYIDSFVYDFSFISEPDYALRSQLEAMSLSDLQAKARQHNIDESEVDFKNHRHLSRMIERTNSVNNLVDNNSADSKYTSLKLRPSRKIKPQNILLIGVKIDREQLVDRITKRVDTMFTMGLIDEVQNLITRYGTTAPGLLAAGYRDMVKYLAEEIDLTEAKQLFTRSHRYLAKRQQTWFKRNKDIIWIQTEDEALEYVTDFTRV